MRKITHQLTLLENAVWSSDTHVLRFSAPSLVGEWQPGQFLELSCGALLKRPFAIMDEKREEGSLRIGVKIVGERSAYLAGLKKGAVLEATAPLGRGWRLNRDEEILAVGGGSGLFPLVAALKAQGRGRLICGFRSPELAFDKEELALDCPVYFSSDSGGLDFHGNAAEALRELIARESFAEKTVLLACGPKALLAACQEFAAEKGIPCQISLEERMACGLGLCLGCAVDILDEEGRLQRVRCCVEGPVFDAERVLL